MWTATNKSEEFFDQTFYQNENDDFIKIKTLLIIKHRSANNNVQDNSTDLIIDFANRELADQFYEDLPQLSVFYCLFNDFNSYNNSSYCYRGQNKLATTKVKINLSAQKELDLQVLCRYLTKENQDIPQDILTTIISNARNLSETEQKFYAVLPELNYENFDQLFNHAKNIALERSNQILSLLPYFSGESNALWDLAIACKNQAPCLTMESEEVLKNIKKGSNYYSEAQYELTNLLLFKLKMCRGSGLIDHFSEKELLKKIIMHCLNIETSKGELLKTIMINFIYHGSEFSNNNELFKSAFYETDQEHVVNLIVDLLVQVKSLSFKQYTEMVVLKNLEYENIQKALCYGYDSDHNSNNFDPFIDARGQSLLPEEWLDTSSKRKLSM